MEADAKEPTGVTRGQNAVHVMPPDWAGAEGVLTTLVDRIDASRAEPQLLVVTADAESAAAASTALVRTIGERDIRVVAATASPRAARLLRASPAHIVTGAPAELVALLQGSALKPAAVRGVLFAWLDPILETAEAQPLETLLGELPKEGARVVLAAEVTPALETLIERYARRARRAPEAATDESAPINAEYVAGAERSRGATLRRLLDALDMPRAVLHARGEELRREAVGVARSLGYTRDSVRLASDDNAASNDPLVLLDLPASRDELKRLMGTAPRKLYALVQPSQLAALRAMLGGGSLSPISLIDAAERARGKDAALRASLRDVLASGDVRREVLALEPLLAEYDGIEIAAAALRMLEQQKPARPAHAAAQSQPMQRLFVNLGEKDGVRAQEIVTAVTTEAGIPGSQVGKVEVRDNHSIVEIAASVASLVVDKITGTMVRGRRVQARIDQPRAPGDRPERGGPRGAGAPRGGRSFDRGERPARSFDRGDRPARPPRSFDKGDRPARPGSRPFEKGGERPSRPFGAGPRKFDRDAGPARPPRPRPRRDDA